MSQDEGKKGLPFGPMIERAMDTKAREKDRERALESPELKAALQQVGELQAQEAVVAAPVAMIDAAGGKRPSSRPGPVVQTTERMEGAGDPAGNETMHGLGPAKGAEAAPPSTPTAFATSGAETSQVRAKEPVRAIDRAQERWKGSSSPARSETEKDFIDVALRMAAAEEEVAAERAAKKAAAEEERTPVRPPKAAERREPTRGVTAELNTTTIHAAMRPGPPVPLAEAMSERTTQPMGIPAATGSALAIAPVVPPAPVVAAVPPAPIVPAAPSFPPVPSPLDRGGPTVSAPRPATVGGNTQRLPAKEEPPAATPWAREATAPRRPDPKLLPSSSMPAAVPVEKEPRSAATPGRRMVWTVAIGALVLAALAVAFLFRPRTGDTPAPATSASSAPLVVPPPSGAPAPPTVSSIAAPQSTAMGSAAVAPPPQAVSARVAPPGSPPPRQPHGSDDPYDSGTPSRTVVPPRKTSTAGHTTDQDPGLNE